MYLALYRKYRPRTFDDVISQPHITTTLKNQVQSAQVGHAYIFTGSRGTGKTSCAKILAKAANCLEPVNGNPCLKCANCIDIENGSTDILEIDAASNNGVDDVRELREEVNYTPVSCKFRVYIIDEVHMMTSSAFNALLKTLEEPPKHVIFILATTEIHKVPETVRSRCQRFEFRRINPSDNAKLLLNIAADENVSLNIDAAELISRLSDGGMRDSISLLERCAGQSANITVSTVMECAGVAGREYLFELSDCLINPNIPKALILTDNLHKQSKDIGRLVIELVQHFRNLMIHKAVPEEQNLITATPDELKLYTEQTQKVTLSQILRCLTLLQECGEIIPKASSARVTFEMYLIRICSPKNDTDPQAILSRLDSLEYKINSIIKGEFKPAYNNSSENPLFIDAQSAIAVSKEEIQPEYAKSINSFTVDEDVIEEAKSAVDEIKNIMENVQKSKNITYENDSYSEIPLPEPPVYEEFKFQTNGYSSIKLNENPIEETAPPFGEPTVPYDEPTAAAMMLNNTETAKQALTDVLPPVLTDTSYDFIPNADIEVSQWREIIESSPSFLAGILDSTKAYFHNDSIHIVSENKIVKPILELNENMSRLRMSVENILGRQYNIVVMSVKEEKETLMNVTERLLERAKELKINVKIV